MPSRSHTSPPLLEEALIAFVDRLDAGDDVLPRVFAETHVPEPERRSFRIEATIQAAVWSIEQGRAPRAELFEDLVEGGERDEVERGIDAATRSLRRLRGVILPGDRLSGPDQPERFSIEHELGRGGGGVVYSVFDHRLGVRRAAKALAEGGKSDDAGARTLLSEARALASLDHPNVVRVFEVVDGPPAFAVMELLVGRTLDEVLRSVRAADELEPEDHDAARLSAARRLVGPKQGAHREDLLGLQTWHRFAAALVERVARAVHEAHACGLTHSDLKPSNVMVIGGGHPVLIDFHLSRPLDELNDDPSIHGTIGYLAPEQIGTAPFASRPVDVFQLGLILYETLTLHPAYPDEVRKRWGAYASALRSGTFRPVHDIAPGVPHALVAIVLKALERDPDHRYVSPLQMAQDLRAFLEYRPADVVRTSPLRRALGWARFAIHQPRVRAVAGATAALALVFLLADRLIWRPPEVHAFGFHFGGEQHEDIGPSSALASFDEYGVQVLTEDPVVLYGMRLYGRQAWNPDEPGAFTVLPAAARILGDTTPRPAEPLELPEGKTLVHCGLVEPRRPYQGIYVILSRGRDPLLERWFAQLRSACDLESLGYGIEFDRASGMLEDLKAVVRDADSARIPEGAYDNLKIDRPETGPLTGIPHCYQFVRVFRTDEEKADE